jgi:hypothetical protein
MTIQGRIQKHLKNIQKLFKNVPENKKNLLNSLMENAAFMEVQLEEMQVILNNEEITKTERKEVVQQYNSMSKNYLSCMTKLLETLPQEEETDELKEFLAKRKN